MRQVGGPVYGEHNVTLRYRVCDLLWRPAGRLVRFVVVLHTRGSCILMCTDTSLTAVSIPPSQIDRIPHKDNSSAIQRVDGFHSKTVKIAIVAGRPMNAPGIPQRNPQKKNAINITKGEIPRVFPEISSSK